VSLACVWWARRRAPVLSSAAELAPTRRKG